MMKKVASYLIIFLIIIICGYYFFQKENTSLYNRSTGDISLSKNQGKFVPEKETDYIFVTTNSEFSLNFQNLIVIILSLSVILLIVRKVKK
jgi:uncharacterized protein YxeA